MILPKETNVNRTEDKPITNINNPIDKDDLFFESISDFLLEEINKDNLSNNNNDTTSIPTTPTSKSSSSSPSISSLPISNTLPPFTLQLNEINTFFDIFNSFTKPIPFINHKRKRHYHKIKPPSIRKQTNYIIYTNPSTQSTSHSVSIMSYNILNQLFVRKEFIPELTLHNRMSTIKDEITTLLPDIFCLQEADVYTYNHYFSSNNFGTYNTVYGINCGSSFANVIGYNKYKFILKSLKNFSLIHLGKHSGNRGVVHIQLEHIKSKEILSIYNIHLPRKRENDRISIMKQIYTHIKENDNNNISNYQDEINCKSFKQNVIIVGDFNAEPCSKVIEMIKGNDNDDIQDELKNVVNYVNTNHCLQSAYGKYRRFEYDGEVVERHPVFTAGMKGGKRNIDYILYGKGLVLQKVLKLPTEEEIDKDGGMPNKKFPSDHVKLFAEFGFGN